ncbi:hypothetical protein [Wenyingzhuangia sp. IMCC45574]
MSSLIDKIRRVAWHKLVSFSKEKRFYLYLYKSYWRSLIFKGNSISKSSEHYFTAQPNLGAGIGHQIANWIAGYWFAKKFNLPFAHLPFSSNKWESFLGFGEVEISVDQLVKSGYKKVKIPLFKEGEVSEVATIKRIIKSYKSKKVIFVCEQDQYYRDQYGVIEELKTKFYNAKSRNCQELVYEKKCINIAIHVRRGDILNDPSNPNLQMRYISNGYFEKVLDEVLKKYTVGKKYAIFFFSQGKPEDYKEFNKYKELNWCLDYGAQESFLHMAYADILITSKSSFSYKPALLNKGVKIVPEIFWHGYPKTNDWVMCNNNGEFVN